MRRTIITGIGSYIPTQIKTNRSFLLNEFYDENKLAITADAADVIDKFKTITGIEERRYVSNDLNTSDIATIAAREAIADSKIDVETLDQIIVAHNFGNVLKHTTQTDLLPSMASRIKHNVGIQNPYCVAYDVLFGCPGWIQGLIQAHCYIKAGAAKNCLIVGAETLSRVIDIHDRDSMIYSDGAGACIVQQMEVEENGPGILSHVTMSHCADEAFYLYFGESNFPGADNRTRYLKMKGRKVYEYALKNVPAAMKTCIDMAGINIVDVKKIFIHQANEKLDEGIIKALYKLYDQTILPEYIMPMNIHMLGNSSVATVPTLFDMVLKGKIKNHEIHKGDIVLFASVGGGMNINAVCYRM